MSRRTFAHIDLSALTDNIHRVRTFAPNQTIMAMVKANAYGHGLLPITNALQSTLSPEDGFGVAFLDEALQLRKARITQRICVLQGVRTREELVLASEQQLELNIHDHTQAELLLSQSLTKPITIWLKIDTGMHRLGFLPEQVSDVLAQLEQCQSIKAIHFMTHFACPDELTNEMTKKQAQYFHQAIAEFKGRHSLANSAAIMAWPESHGNEVRPGIMLYGISPFVGKVGLDHGLKPVMTLKSELIAIKQLQQGDTIGYGSTYVCPEAMKVGVITVGYGDGYPRHAQNGTPVLVNDKIVPLVGRVSMDMITVDLRQCPQARVGDTVTLWGQGLPIERVAEQAGTIGYELVTKVTPRVPFRYSAGS